MSGYLQRLASSAMNPGGSIHPVLGSVFSPSTYWTTESFQGESPAFSAPAEQIPSASHVSPAQTPPLAFQKAVDSSVEPQPKERSSFNPLVKSAQPAEEAAMPFIQASPELASPRDAGLQPAQPSASREAANESAVPFAEMLYEAGRLEHEPNHELTEPVRNTARILKNAGLETGTSDFRIRQAPTVMSASERIGQQASGESAYEAVGTDEPNPEPVTPGRDAARISRNAGLELPTVPRIPPFVTVTSALDKANRNGSTEPVYEGVGRDGENPEFARRERKTDWPRRAARPERETGDIQIHIGRIEVTAVPPAPAPARPEARLARKSLNLDEYLKRRNGRAG